MTEKANRKYKDSVFVDLFYEDESAEANEIALYNALHDEPLPEGTEIRKFRVDDILYMNFRNDISFGVGGKLLVFGEHQSTINENMPLRSLMYIGRAFEQLVPIAQRYKRHRVMLPKPEFYTFYNGEEPWTKEKIMHLSDSYKTSDGEIMLDLAVKVININSTEQHEILKKCPILAEYSQFVDVVRKHQKSGEEHAFQNAVAECIEHGILVDYLQKKGSEAVNMLIAEYDYDMDIKVQREEAKEEGIALGEKRGRQLGKTDSIIALLEDLGIVPDDLKTLITNEEDTDILKKWLKLAAASDSIEMFQEKMYR